MKKNNIGVFFGGKSPEHDVSIITGQLIISELKKLGYNVEPIYLSKEGEWFLGEKMGTLETFCDLNKKEERLKNAGNYFLDLAKIKNKMVFRKKGLLGKEVVIDLAFPAFHGMNGEDGTIQGTFEMFNIPYVGCDLPSSAIAMDKALTKLIYKSEEIPTTKFIYFNDHDWNKNREKILTKVRKELNLPIFIKPARLGSSIGMSKIGKLEELESACEVALHYDSKIVIEEGVENLADITCAVLGNENPQPSLIQESLFSDKLFSFESKYLDDGGAQLGNATGNIIIPAKLSEEVTEKIQKMAVKIFKVLGCSGIARADFLYDRKNDFIYANEVNPLPGTLYHHLWKKSGIEIGELLEKLIWLAKEKHQAKNKISHSFNSEILKQANSTKLQIKNNG